MPQLDLNSPSRWALVPGAGRRPSRRHPLHRQEDGARKPPNHLRQVADEAAALETAFFAGAWAKIVSGCDHNSAVWELCGAGLVAWHSSRVPVYRLKERA